MCEVIDYYINVGEERGIQQGIQQGIQKGIRQKEFDAISKIAAYLRTQDTVLTGDKAREMAEKILR